MITFKVKKRYNEQGEEVTPQLRALKSDMGGKTWHIVYDNVATIDTQHSASGADSFLKKDLALEYSEAEGAI